MKRILPHAAIVALFATSSIFASAQQLELYSGSASTSATGPVTSASATLAQNTGTSATFTAYTPATTVSVSFSNQQYTSSSFPGMTIGAVAVSNNTTTLGAANIFVPLNNIASPLANMFTSAPDIATAGTNMSITTNHAFRINTDGFYLVGQSNAGRFYYGNVTLTFNRPVINPVIHVSGFGGSVKESNVTLGFYTELELSTPDSTAGYTFTRLSGSTHMLLDNSSTKILNNATLKDNSSGTTLYASDQENAGAGSLVLNTNNTPVTSVTFRVYLEGDGGTSSSAVWGVSGSSQGRVPDTWLLSASLGLYNVSGTVFDDANGLVDNTVNGTGSNGGGLFANLVDANGNVYATTAVAANGTYTFSNIITSNYIVILTTVAGTVGSPLSTATLPSGYISTGENIGTAAGNDGTADSRLAVTVSNATVVNVNFGIQRDYDFGDAPVAYENNSTPLAQPARNIPAATLKLGATTDAEFTAANVAANADNNGTNGDGADEDGVTPSALTVNTVYNITVTFTNNSGTARPVTGWIDFNNNGIFESTEFATTASQASNATLNRTVTLSWTAAQASDVSASQLYMRIRLAGGALTDNAGTTVDERAIADGVTGGVYGTALAGEVEDYRISVLPAYDMGDVPVSYEANNAATSVPARNIPSATLMIGTLPDAELIPASVTSPADNNGTNGDGADEDGISGLPVAVIGGQYPLSVLVTNTSGTARTLHGWIDFNNNGRFESGEYQSVNVPTGTSNTAVTLLWTAVQTATVTAPGSRYMRLRLAGATLADAASATVDERSIADGANTGVYGTSVIGETEDYQVGFTNTDIEVSKTGPPSINQGGTISYLIHVSNYGAASASNITVSDPAVTGLTVTAITCTTAGTGSPGSSSCPASTTVAALQAGTLTIPTLPAGSSVTFTVTATASGSVNTWINNTVAVSLPAGLTDANPSNNTSTLSTYIRDACSGATTVYTLDPTATVNNNTVSPNGGTINLTYTLTSGTAVPGIGASFTIPYQYSDLNAFNGTDHQWMTTDGAGTGGISNSYGIYPTTSDATSNPTANSIYNSRPANNQQQETSTGAGVDLEMSTYLQNGNIDQSGTFSVTIGNYPGAPAGYMVLSKTLQITTVNNLLNVLGNGNNQGGYLLKFIDESRSFSTSNTPIMDVEYGNTYGGKYAAFWDGASGHAPQSGTAGRGVHIRGSVTYMNVSACADLSIVKTGTATATANGNVSYSLVVTNNGPTAATNATVSDPGVANFIATGVSCSGATGGAVCLASLSVAALQAGTLAIPSLPVGGSVTLLVSGTAGTGSSITNVASVSPPAGMTDGNSANNSSSAVTAITTLTISGNVYNDANGLNPTPTNTVDGTGTNAGGLNAVLADASTGNVIAVVAVSAGGTYTFSGIGLGNYNVIITTNIATVGNPAPVVALPAGWASTGENLGAAAGNDGTVNGILPLGAVNTDLSNANFGIERTPTANNVSGTYTNPGGTATVQVPTLNGSDPEQGTYPGTGNADTVVINTLPASGTLFYNGTLVTAGQQINNYNPVLLAYDPPTGGGTYTFTYSEIDAAGKTSAPATVSMTFNALTIGGNVYNDANGLNDNIVNGTGTNPGNSLNAILIDATTGLVVAAAPVNAGGTYSFANLDGGKYQLEITINAATTGAAAPAVALPSGWIATGENLGATAGNDGTVNSILSLGTVSANITDANFGMEQLPNSDNKTATIAQPAPNSFITLNGGNNPAFFTGSDPEDQVVSGTLLNKSVQINTLPANGQLWYNGTQITSAGTVLSGFDPSLMQFKATGSGYASVNFSYAYVDAAGIADPTPAGYTLNWLYALPVKLVSFEAKAEDCKAILNWTTAEERDVNRFVIERSTDGGSYKPMGATPAKNEATGSSYNVNYAQYNGSAYYRLKMEDKDGSFSYSNTVTVKVNCTEVKQIKLWPNPATEQLTVEGLEAGGQVIILSNTGQHIKTLHVTGATQNIDLNGIPAGMYQLRVQDASGNGATLKFVKQ